jgi:hypothetical protein
VLRVDVIRDICDLGGRRPESNILSIAYLPGATITSGKSRLLSTMTSHG